MISIFNNKIIKSLIILNLTFLAIILFSKMFFLHKFIKIIFKAFLIPLIISLFLFYIIRTLNIIFIKKGLKPGISAFLTLTISLFIVSGLSYHFSRYLIQQFKVVTIQFTDIIENNNSISENNPSTNEFLDKINKYININGIYKTLTNTAQNFLQNIRNNFLVAVRYVINTFSKILLVLVILFYLLKDGVRFKNKVLSLCPDKYKTVLSKILSESDTALSSYVTGQFKVALALATMIFIGYKIIGMPNALLLSSITFILAFIPFIGFIISMIFPSIIALNIGLFMVIKLAITFIIVQTLKGRVVVPAIMATVMKIHPLTDIVLVIGAIALNSSIAAFAIVPIYAIIKIMLVNLYKVKLESDEAHTPPNS